MTLRTFFTALVFGLCALPCIAKPPPPPRPVALFSIPSAVMPGARTDVKFTDMDGQPLGLWTAFASQSVPSSSQNKPGEAKFRITVGPNVPVGIYAVRPMTSSGVSHLRLLMVDDLPTILRQHGNTSLHEAQTVSLPIAIDGGCEPAAAHYYRFAAKRGQTLATEVVAQRIGSPMDPMIRLLDSAGRELAYSDDSPGAGADCRFRHTFAADGDYFIEIRDVNYDGGPGFRYHLRLGDFPLVSSVSPLGGMRGAQVSFHLHGEGCEACPDISVTLPDDVERTWLKVKYPGGQGSALVPVLCGDVPDAVESKPNHTPRSGNHLVLPACVTACFTHPVEPAYFEFTADRSERISIRGQTRAIDSQATLSLQLLDASGNEIASSDLAPVPKGSKKKTSAGVANTPDDGSLSASLPAPGVYRVRASELAGAAGPGMFYRLEIRPVTPGFTLSVESDIATAMPGESFKIKVAASRRNYTGPINLALSGDGSGFKIDHAIIPAGKSDTELEIHVLPAASKAQPLNFSIIGQATIDGVSVTAKASTRAELMKLFPRLPYPPPELDGLIGLAPLSGQKISP